MSKKNDPTGHETTIEALERPIDTQLTAALQGLIHSAQLFRRAYLGQLLGEHPPGELPEENLRALQDAERCIAAWAERFTPSKVSA